MPTVLNEIDFNIKNTVFSYIPNTAETSFYGMIESVEEYLNSRKSEEIIGKKGLSEDKIKEILSIRPRIEKIAVKDVKLRTFITEDDSRDDLVEHVYDITYGVVKNSDNLVIIDDSIVRGTTLRESILKMLFRLNPKKIVVVSSAPQIRYPDCYGIDMAKIEDLIAFRATIELHKDAGTFNKIIDLTYEKCLKATKSGIFKKNHVKDFYKDFTAEQISIKMSEMLVDNTSNVELDIIFQKVENLHRACKNHKGDWYFTGKWNHKDNN